MGGKASRLARVAPGEIRELSDAELLWLQGEVRDEVERLELEKARLFKKVEELETQGSVLSGLPPPTPSRHHHLPEGLDGFGTIGDSLECVALQERLAFLSTHVEQDPHDEDASSALEATVKEYASSLDTVVLAKLDEDGVVQACDRAVSVGDSDFLDVYQIIWARVQRRKREVDVYLKEASKLPVGVDFQGQRTDDAVLLFRDAARIKPQFEAYVDSLVASLDDLSDDDVEPALSVPKSEIPMESQRRVSFSDDSATQKTKRKYHLDVELVKPRELKKLTRICEKAALRPDRPGAAGKICDVVRCMLVVRCMRSAAAVLKVLVESKQVVISRAKERFVSAPTSGGWRDCLVNVYLKDDPRQHVCEIQIVHRELMVARKGLPGHAIYNVVRNANELLDRIGVGQPCKRYERVARLREAELTTNPGGYRLLYTPKYFRRLGVSLSVLVKANCFSPAELRSSGEYTAQELREQGVDLAALLSAGYSAGDLKAADAGDPGALLAAGYSKQEVFAAFQVRDQPQIDAAVLSHIAHACAGGVHSSMTISSQTLRGLDLKKCSLQGPLPETLGLLANLERLDLSQNPLLSGQVPRSLTRLAKLHWLHLSGRVTLPGSGAFLPSVGLDPCRETRGKIEMLFQYLHHVDLGHLFFETRLSLGILWNGLTVAAVVGQAKTLGVKASWVASGLDDETLGDLLLEGTNQDAAFKARLTKRIKKSAGVRSVRLRFSGPAPWFYNEEGAEEPFPSVLAVEVERAYKRGAKRVRLEDPEEKHLYDFDFVHMTQTHVSGFSDQPSFRRASFVIDDTGSARTLTSPSSLVSPSSFSQKHTRGQIRRIVRKPIASAVLSAPLRKHLPLQAGSSAYSSSASSSSSAGEQNGTFLQTVAAVETQSASKTLAPPSSPSSENKDGHHTPGPLGIGGGCCTGTSLSHASLLFLNTGQGNSRESAFSSSGGGHSSRTSSSHSKTKTVTASDGL